MDIITSIIYIILFVIMMIFVFSIGMIRKYMPKKEILLVILVAFLIGSIGGAFFLEPIYQEVPSVMTAVERNMPNNEETLYLDLSSSNDLAELENNLSHTDGFKSYNEESVSISLWSFSDTEKSYFEEIVGNIDDHYKNYTVNSSGKITIYLADNYSAFNALKSFSLRKTCLPEVLLQVRWKVQFRVVLTMQMHQWFQIPVSYYSLEQ